MWNFLCYPKQNILPISCADLIRRKFKEDIIKLSIFE